MIKPADISRVITLALILYFYPFRSGAADPFCAVTIRVVGPSGSPAVDARAKLLDSSGATVQESRVRDGNLQFCDFEFGPHSVIIGEPESCAAVTLHNLNVVYAHEQRFLAVLNYCSGQGSGFSTACFIYVRVKSDSGMPLHQVQVTQHGFKPVYTDPFGRVLLAVQPRDIGHFVFAKDGFASQSIVLECPRVTDRQSTKSVTLMPAK